MLSELEQFGKTGQREVIASVQVSEELLIVVS